MAGIFIGISSALLAGLIYGILANEHLFQTFINETTIINAPREVWVLRIIASVLGIGIIIILLKLKGWLGRVTFLQQINFQRMREIELELGMWKSWRVHTIDKWHKIGGHKKRHKKIWNELWEELKKNLDTKYSKLLDKRKRELVGLCIRYLSQKDRKKQKIDPKYVPSSGVFFACIFWTIFSLWVILVLSVWVLPIIMDCLTKPV